MKPFLTLAALLTLGACVQPSPRVTIVSSVTPDQREACVNAAAAARGTPPELVRATQARATETGPVVTLALGTEQAYCKLNELGDVVNVTFGVDPYPADGTAAS